MIGWRINCSVNKLWNKFCFVEIKTESDLDFNLRRYTDVGLRVKGNEGILRRYIKICQNLETDKQPMADVIKDRIVEDESSESDLLQLFFLADLSFQLKSRKHNV